MGWYKLVPSRRPDRQYDEVKFRSEDGIEKTASIHYPVELTDEDVAVLSNLHYPVRGADEPEEDQKENPVGDDVAGMTPVVEGGEISQVGSQTVQQGAKTETTTPTDKGESH